MNRFCSRPCLVILAVLAATGGMLEAQKPSVRPNQNQSVVMANDRRALQRSLDEAAAAGLHVVFGNNEGIFLNRIEALGAPGEYRAIREGGSDEFERALDSAAQQGFRLIPATLTRSDSATVAVMRRAPAALTVYRYRVLASNDAFERNIRDLRSKGFSIVGVFTQQSGIGASMLGRPGRLHVVLESSGSRAPSTLPAQMRVVSTMRASTMEKEINQAAAEGYRVLGGSFMNVLLEKASIDAPASAYRVLGAIRGTTLTNEINQAAREGYRVVPSAIMSNPSSKSEAVVVMEQTPANARRYEYSWRSSPNVNRYGFEPAGFVPVALVRLGLVMEDDFGNQLESGPDDYFVLLESLR